MSFINIQDAADLLYPSDMRKLDMIDTQGEERDKRIAKQTREYFEDPGTFFEFIQNIEIDINDIGLYGDMHVCLIRSLPDTALSILNELFEKYCEDKAIKDENRNRY